MPEHRNFHTIKSHHKVLITGGTGFLGGAIARLALTSGSEVAVLTRSPGKTFLPESVTKIGGGLANPDWSAIEEFAPDICFHCAWVAAPGVYLTSPENVHLAEQTLDFAKNLISRNLKKFIGFGTCLEYECSFEPLNEGSKRSSDQTPYVVAKGKVLDGLESATNGCFAWLRIFYAYGPGEHEKRFISYAARLLGRNETLHINRPKDIVDYIHVRDIASAAAVVAGNGDAKGVFNVGSGTARTVHDVAMSVARFFNRPKAVICGSQDDPVCRVANSTRLQNMGWLATRNFEASVIEICELVKPMPREQS
jgi:nucleoside-diphosphate-sugar epimerase